MKRWRYQDRQRLIEQALAKRPGLERLDTPALHAALLQVIEEASLSQKLSLHAKQALAQSLMDCMRGLDILEPLRRDPAVSEIMVNAPDRVFVERQGRLYPAGIRFDNKAHVHAVITSCFGKANHRINQHDPICSMRLADGSRLHALLPPIAQDGAALSLRRFQRQHFSLARLEALGSITAAERAFLVRAVRERQNIFISGGTGSGKTSFLNALSEAIPERERVITIEDTAELSLQALPNALSLVARPPNPEGKGGIDLSELIRSALRLRPDRIIVGEVRGAEAYPMIEAMSTGHPGSMSTGHGNSPEAMLKRLRLLLLSAVDLPFAAIASLLASSIDLLVHLERDPQGRRRLASIARIMGQADGSFHLERLETRRRDV